MIDLDLPPDSILPGTFRALLRDAQGNTTQRTPPRGRFAVSPAETLHFHDDAEQPPLTDGAVASLAGMPHLGFVNLRATSLTAAGIAHLASIPALKYLSLQWMTPATGELLAPLGRCATLTSLELRYCATGDDALALAAGLPALEYLHCSPPIGQALSVTDAGLARLAAAPSLVALELQAAGVTGEGLAAWAGCHTLRSIEIARSAVLTDANVALLAPLTGLTSVRLPNSPRLTDAIFDVLAKLPALEWIDLQGCGKVTDAGLMKLAGLAALRLVYVGSSKSARKVTSKGIAAFQQAHGLARCVRH